MRREYIWHIGLLLVTGFGSLFVHWRIVDTSDVERVILSFSPRQVDEIRIYSEDGLFEGERDKEGNFVFRAISRQAKIAKPEDSRKPENLRFRFWAREPALRQMFDSLNEVRGRYTAEDSSDARTLYGFSTGYFVEFKNHGKVIARAEVSSINPKTSAVYMIPDNASRIYKVPLFLYRMVERPDLELRVRRPFQKTGRNWREAWIERAGFRQKLVAKLLDERGNLGWTNPESEGIFDKAYHEILKKTQQLEVRNLATVEQKAKLQGLSPIFHLKFMEGERENTTFALYRLDEGPADNRYWGQTNQLGTGDFYHLAFSQAKDLEREVVATMELHQQMSQPE